MKNASRITKSLKNAKVALGFYIINLILQFFYRKVFLEYLGAEYLGLNTTAMNLLQFLNLAELGVGAAVSYSLYKPLAIDDKQQIIEIVSVQGYLYNRIGIIVACAAVILMLFFPFFFSDIKIPVVYAYVTFGVLLISALVGYFLNYQQILLVSDQKEYKLNYVLQGVKIVKVILQIVSISLFTNGYIWWLLLEFIAVFITIWGIRYILVLEYPWLKTNVSYGKTLLNKYSEITRKTKQLFTHKIAAFALNQSSPLVIYAFTSLSFVAIYGNYLLVIAGVTALIGAVFNSLNAGIGNLVSEGERKRIMSVFNELFTVRFFLASIACFGIYKLTPVFIFYWVGKEFILEDSSLILMTLIMFINLTRLTVDSFLNAYGLFEDIIAPIIEATLNIGLSILLGYFFGINGVLTAVLLSLVIIILAWKPYFLFKSGFKSNISHYFKMYFKLLTMSVISFLIMCFLESFIKIDVFSSFINFMIFSFIILSIYSVILFFGYLVFTKGMQDFFYRFKNRILNT